MKKIIIERPENDFELYTEKSGSRVALVVRHYKTEKCLGWFKSHKEARQFWHDNFCSRNNLHEPAYYAMRNCK